MSSGSELDLALRRQRLLARSASLRAALATQSSALEAPLAVADRVHAGARWLYRQRAWVAGGVVVVLVARPRRVWRLLRFGWWAWRNAQRALPWLMAAGFLVPQRH